MWLNFKKKKKHFFRFILCLSLLEFLPHEFISSNAYNVKKRSQNLFFLFTFLDMINNVVQPAGAHQGSRYYGWAAERRNDFTSNSLKFEALFY